MCMKSSILGIKIEDGVDDSTNVFEFERKLDIDSDGPIDPDFKPCGATISWKAEVPRAHYEIVVRTNDGGDIPHFHVVDANTGGKQFSACVQIERAEYFRHGIHKGTLNSSERKALDAFLRKTPRNDRRSNWRRVVDEWNRNNSKRKIDDSVVMPDFRQIIDNHRD